MRQGKLYVHRFRPAIGWYVWLWFSIFLVHGWLQSNDLPYSILLSPWISFFHPRRRGQSMVRHWWSWRRRSRMGWHLDVSPLPSCSEHHWDPVTRLTAQLTSPQTNINHCTGVLPQDIDLIVGPGKNQYTSVTWSDLAVIAPWMKHCIKKRIDGPGLGNWAAIPALLYPWAT